ncbi:MAG: CHAD domain-containing protein [Planctomycetes bacterium]|nr:CHAD domain-containing protein [Planctomycetota bacterium]
MITDRLPPTVQLGHRVLARFAKRTLRELLDEFGRKLADVAEGRVDPVEATHQLRVVSRRTDVALRVFKAWISPDRRKRMQQYLKRVRLDAGAVRDLDLLELRWRPGCGDLAMQVLPATAGWMHTRIQSELSRFRDRLLRWTRHSATCRLNKKSMALVRTIGRQKRRLETPVVDRALVKLQQSLQKSIPVTSSSLVQSHQTRIHARRLRYALKLLQPILWGDVASFIVQLVTLQDELGQINDEATGIEYQSASLESCTDPAMKLELKTLMDRMRDAAAEHLRSRVVALFPLVASEA